jgi:DNA-binding IclR family transcriptional regulator
MGVGPASQAILAFLPPDEADAIIDANARLYERYHDLSADKIRARLPEIRTQRFAVDHGELVAGISALAVPILPTGRDAIASIAINMTSARLDATRQGQLVEVLREQVARVEAIINPLEVTPALP